MIVLQVALLHLGAALSPGPDIFLTIRNALLFGAKAARYTVAGIVAGVSIQIGACLFGLAWVLARYPLVFDGIALVGGGYLVWIGWLGLRCPAAEKGDLLPTEEPATDLRRRPFLLQGLLTNLLNPKAILYFIGLFSLVLTEDVSATIRIVSGLAMIAVQLLAFWIVAGSVSSPKVRGCLLRYQKWIARVLGGVLILFGGRLIYGVLY